MMTKSKRVCDNIAELYFKRGCTQKFFSDCIGAGNECVGNWINKRSDPQSAFIPRIAAFFDVPIARLFEGVE